MIRSFLLFTFFVLKINAVDVPKIPSFLQICHRNVPHLNDCISRSIESLKPYLKTGVPELGIPPCEPFIVPEIELGQTNGPISLKSIYQDVKVWGASEFVLKNVRLEMEKDRLLAEIYIPRLSIQAYYNVIGQILMLPIASRGLAFGNYTDLDARIKIQAERYNDKKSGNRYVRIIDFRCDFDFGGASIYLDNLFNGDKALGDAMNVYLNENWKIVAKEIKPAIEDNMAGLFKSFANKLFDRFPIDVLLPP